MHSRGFANRNVVRSNRFAIAAQLESLDSESVPVVPLYHAAPRSIARRDGSLIVACDDRIPYGSGEAPEQKHVRSCAPGRYPFKGTIEPTVQREPGAGPENFLNRAFEQLAGSQAWTGWAR